MSDEKTPEKTTEVRSQFYIENSDEDFFEKAVSHAVDDSEDNNDTVAKELSQSGSPSSFSGEYSSKTSESSNDNSIKDESKTSQNAVSVDPSVSERELQARREESAPEINFNENSRPSPSHGERQAPRSENRAPRSPHGQGLTMGNVDKVVRILDLYRAIDDSKKDDVVSIITQGDGAETEGEFIYKAMKSDPLLSETMTSIKKLKEMPIHKRGIATLRERDEIFDSVESFVSVFVEMDELEITDKLDRADRLADSIESISQDVIESILIAEEILSVNG